jgi:glycosyltransferase involved in cell wall biosynthesis
MIVNDDGASIDVMAIDAAQRELLRPQIARATVVDFQTAEEQNVAVSVFGPGIVAKSRVANAPKATLLAIDGAGRRIDQVTPTFDSHDAISDEAVFVRDALRASGFASTIYSPLIGERSAAEADSYAPDCVRDADAVIYHFGIGSSVSTDIARLRNRRALWYHNITPAAYFRQYSPMMTHLLETGRAQLEAMLPLVDTLIADSAFNARELAELTNKAIDVVPFAIDFRRFDTLPDAGWMPVEEGVRWLVVGRIVPNKGLLRLVRAFAAYAAVHRDAQLILAGAYRASDPFHLHLRFEVDRLGLDARVVFAGSVTDGQLLALYESADIYVTLSEHEGFCVPIVEAMFFDVPVIASTAGAIPETLGAAGIMVEDDAEPWAIAALVEAVLTDDEVRCALLAAQLLRRQAFLPDSTGPPLRAAIERALPARRSGA